MFNTNFEKAFVDCLQRQRDFYLIFKDVTSGNIDDLTLTINSIAPQYAVSVFHFDAAQQRVSVEEIAESFTKRAKTIVNPSKFSDYSSDIDKVCFASQILEDSLIVLHNADKVIQGELMQLQQLSSQISEQTGARLRIAAIGDMGLVHSALRDQLKFINLKFYNLMKDSAEMDAVLTRVTDMTVGTRWGGLFDTHDKKDGAADSFIYFGKQI